ncbi:MAG: aminopeptidase [Bacteroidia bacterium]|nr:aminopeptidase [Bacteroidia bacterium]
MKIRILLLVILSTIIAPSYAQKKKLPPPPLPKTEEEYKFTPVVELKATSVKNQSSTGTCWCFATTSFIESELLRMGKGEYDLSEMFIVRQDYIDKLKDNYLRQGKGNLGEGGLSHDWMRVFTESGIVPDEVYNGLNYGSPTHNHGELQGFINAVAAVPVQRKKESAQYHQIVDAVLDAYLGKVPESFTYKGVTYTPKSFAESLGINPADYVEITSFTHFPFYTQGVLEVPDNWRMERFYNVPLDELTEIMDYSLNNGYTVNWDGDVSENGFTHSKGIAVYPEDTVTQDMRQAGYENFTTTDDHLMHITGIVKDQNGAKYYVTKNSWGTTNNPFEGYLNMSENFVRAKTLFIMVHKDAVPAAIRTKLGF